MGEASNTKSWRLNARRAWRLDRPHVLGILNVTPDSFSDGGVHARVQDAVCGAERMLTLGADGLDIGGESTRPGAQRVTADEQIRRVVPVIQAIRRDLGDGFAITVDTTLGEVAHAALGAGADAINDVSAGRDDAGMFRVASAHDCGMVLMHRLTVPENDSYSTGYLRAPEYHGGVVPQVKAFLSDRTKLAMHEGVRPDGIVIDPGLGFGKSVEQNLELIAATPEFEGLGYAVMSALSRKSFTAHASGLPASSPPTSRVNASVGLSVMHLTLGARFFRVHDVGEHVQALRAAWRVMGTRASK